MLNLVLLLISWQNQVQNLLTNHRAYLSQPITSKQLNTVLVTYPTDLPPEQWTELELTSAATET